MKKRKLLVIGHVAKDIVKTNTGGGEFWGGSGYHVALAAAMYLPKDSVLLGSCVGKDFDLKTLKNGGVDTRALVLKVGVNSDRHYLDETGLAREYYAEGSLSEQVTVEALEELLREVSWIHLASAPPEQQLEWLDKIKKFRSNKVIVSCDTFETFAREVPKQVGEVFIRSEVCFLNEVEWDLVDGKRFGMKMVRKLGPLGAEIYQGGLLSTKVATTVVDQVIDTTGAGDVVAGVYIAKIMLGGDDEDALKEACRVATKSVLNFGTDALRM